MDRGRDARIGSGPSGGRRRCSTVIDRAVQAYGAAGLTDDTPLSHMYRTASFARIYDGPDEVHIQSVARRLLKTYRDGGTFSFSG